MVCGQGCGLWDSLIPPKPLNRPVISNKYLDVGCKCLACDFDFLSLFLNSTLFAWNTVATLEISPWPDLFEGPIHCGDNLRVARYQGQCLQKSTIVRNNISLAFGNTRLK